MTVALWFAFNLLGCTCSQPPAEAVERAPTAAEVATFVRSSNALGWDLYESLTDGERPNVVVSPAGVALALAVLEAGSAGATREELLEVLYDGGAEEALQLAVGAVLAARGLTSTSQLIVREGVEVAAPFERVVRRRLGAQVVVAAPSGSAPGGDGVGQIDLGPTARAVVVTHLQFRGRWVHPLLDRAVSPAEFVRLDGERVLVPTMWLRARLRCARVAGATVVELPYEGRRFSMLLARPDGSAPLAQLDVSPATVDAWLEALELSDVELSLPRFAFGPQRHRLDRALVDLGVERASDAERADFSRLATTEHSLSVEYVLQSAQIEVDEYGTRAEATTIVGLVDSAAEPPRLNVHFDRPFLFILRDNETGLVVFLGRIGDPRPREPAAAAP